MTLKDALMMGMDKLKSAGLEAPAVEAGVLLCQAAHRDKTFLYTHGETILSHEELCSYNEMINRRLQGVPLQYITGHQEFMALDFKVNPHVLIPRQDTEVLVETLMKHIGKHSAGNIGILDIGTGSGCIAVSLAYYIKNCLVTAVDISDGALALAQQNAAALGVGSRIDFLKGNLFEGLEGKKFDVIASNPPYIPSFEIDGLQTEVKDHEPLAALDGGTDGLDFYRRIIEKAPLYLKEEGLLAFEVGFGQSQAVSSLMKKSFKDIGIVRDLAQIERVVTGRLKLY